MKGIVIPALDWNFKTFYDRTLTITVRSVGRRRGSSPVKRFRRFVDDLSVLGRRVRFVFEDSAS